MKIRSALVSALALACVLTAPGLAQAKAQIPEPAVPAKPSRAPRPAVVAEAPAPPSAPAAPAVAIPEAPQAPAAPKAPATPAAAPEPPGPPRPRGQMINVRIDVTLSDSKGAPKVLTMTVADGESGMNRTTTSGTADFSFNADALPLVSGNKIRLRLTADAVVPVEGGTAGGGPTPRLGLRQSQTVILSDGESVEIARAADPVSDRAFALSVKATILR